MKNAVLGKFGQLWHQYGCVAYLQWAPAVPNACTTPAWQPLIAWWPVTLLPVRVWCWFQPKIRPKMLFLANLANYDTDMVLAMGVCAYPQLFRSQLMGCNCSTQYFSFFDKPHHQPPHWHQPFFLVKVICRWIVAMKVELTSQLFRFQVFRLQLFRLQPFNQPNESPPHCHISFCHIHNKVWPPF